MFQWEVDSKWEAGGKKSTLLCEEDKTNKKNPQTLLWYLNCCSWQLMLISWFRVKCAAVSMPVCFLTASLVQWFPFEFNLYLWDWSLKMLKAWGKAGVMVGFFALMHSVELGSVQLSFFPFCFLFFLHSFLSGQCNFRKWIDYASCSNTVKKL